MQQDTHRKGCGESTIWRASWRRHSLAGGEGLEQPSEQHMHRHEGQVRGSRDPQKSRCRAQVAGNGTVPGGTGAEALELDRMWVLQRLRQGPLCPGLAPQHQAALLMPPALRLPFGLRH